MPLATFNITGSFQDADGNPMLYGTVTFTPAATTDARVDGASVLLGSRQIDIAALPNPLSITAGGWTITISTRATEPDGDGGSRPVFQTLRIPLTIDANITWGAIVASAVSDLPITPSLIAAAVAASQSAAASATSAAASATTAVTAAGLAGDIANIAVPDDVMTTIDSNPASTFRVQQDARVAGKAFANIFTARQNFHAPSDGAEDLFTGVAADYSGEVRDDGPTGGTFSRLSVASFFAGGTNGVRGDDVTSTAANGAGATYFDGIFLGHTGAGFAGKGSAQGLAFIGALAAHPTGAYGEFGGITSGVTNNRPGGLAAGAEISLGANVQAKNHALAAILTDNAGVAGLPAYNWSRGLFVTQGGSAVAGDAVYIAGAGGWTNFLVAKDSADVAKFWVVSDGAVAANKLMFSGDIARNLRWGAGSPESVVAASVGSVYFRSDGGAGTSMYVKETGVGNTGWVGK